MPKESKQIKWNEVSFYLAMLLLMVFGSLFLFEVLDADLNASQVFGFCMWLFALIFVVDKGRKEK